MLTLKLGQLWGLLMGCVCHNMNSPLLASSLSFAWKRWVRLSTKSRRVQWRNSAKVVITHLQICRDLSADFLGYLSWDTKLFYMPEAVAFCMTPDPGPVLKRRFCDCSRVTRSWAPVGYRLYRLFSNAPKDLMQQYTRCICKRFC